MEDFIQDIDAWNFYETLKINPIDVAFENYYITNKVNRYNGFVTNRIKYGRLPSDVVDTDTNFIKIAKLARSYLSQDWTTTSGIVSTLFTILKTGRVTSKIIIENTAQAFAKKVTSMI